MPGYYSLYACVYNWILEHLIGKIDITLFGLAMHCVAQNVAGESEPEYSVVNSRLNHYALRIEYCNKRDVVD